MEQEEYSRDDLRRVIRRATEIRSHENETLTEDDLRAIGAELGLDASAINRAIIELAEPHDALVAGRSNTTAIREAIGVSVLTGTAANLVTAWVHSAYGMGPMLQALTPAMAIVAVAELRVALRSKGRWDLLKFQAANLATWTGFGVGLMASYYRLDAAAILAILGAAGGTVVIAARDTGDRYKMRKALKYAQEHESPDRINVENDNSQIIVKFKGGKSEDLARHVVAWSNCTAQVI